MTNKPKSDEESLIEFNRLYPQGSGVDNHKRECLWFAFRDGWQAARAAQGDEIVALANHLREALLRAEEHSEGCLYCGEGEIVDGSTTKKHQDECWFYQAERALQAIEKKGGSGE
jgi:hypothetical protein